MLGVGTLEGAIRRRLLVNALVDPDEAAARLPPGVEPHVVDGGTVVGCCLLELAELRPAWAPRAVGLTMRAAAHRVSCEWTGDDGTTVVGVFVPMRHADARAAVLAGGRLFPGVHRSARIEVDEAGAGLRWNVVSDRDPSFSIAVRATPSGPVGPVDSPVGCACIDAAVGLSPRRSGLVEAVEMEPGHRNAQLARIDVVASPFIDSFASAELAPSYLMTDVAVSWSRAETPLLVRQGTPRMVSQVPFAVSVPAPPSQVSVPVPP